MIFFSLTIEFMYYPLVISIHISSNIIMITFLPNIMVKIKYWNQFAVDIPGLAFMLMYNNSASPMLLVCDPSHNITSSIDLLNNSLSPNDHRIPFLQILSKNFHHPLSLTLSWSQSTGLPSRQFLSLPMTPSCLWTQHVYLFFIYSQNMVFISMLSLIETWSLYLIFSVPQVLLQTCGFTLLQATTLKVIVKTKESGLSFFLFLFYFYFSLSIYFAFFYF